MVCECQARFNAKVKLIRKENGEPDIAAMEIITIDYIRQHTGHLPGSNMDITAGTLPRAVTQFIQEQVEQKLTWKNIKNMLRLDKQVLARILETGDYSNMPLAMQVNYNHVYYAMKRYLQRMAYLSDSMVSSLEKWGEKMRQEPGHFLSMNLERHEEGMFFIAFMSNWQLQVPIHILENVNLLAAV